jgi:glyoxylase-like metal-dependent hydrolase (beta-lactamase superfamily II)/rhodanese-related sulfurtransferase
MYFEQFYLSCLAHASYMLGSAGEAVVVDPQRDVEIYIQAAAENKLTIRYIFETHLHADFVSGHRELAQRTGAQICMGAAAGAQFPHRAVRDRDEITFGKCRIRVLETPGHTPESICLVVFDAENGPAPKMVLTGDTLFIGDVGRPDLSPAHTPQQLAGMMYDSLHQKLLTLPDETLVYPAHGAGSLCGRNMRADKFSTIGTERLTNPSLQIKTRDEFIEQLTSNLPARPEYFLRDAEINRVGAPSMDELIPAQAFSPAELVDAMENGVIALDVRHQDSFAQAHVPGSINVPLGGQFASWAGAVVGLNTPVIVIAENETQVEEARTRLARVGIEVVCGQLAGGVDAWIAAGLGRATVPQITVQELAARAHEFTVLDVRREPEWQSGHLKQAKWHRLDDFGKSLPNLPHESPIAVHCKSGYRSMIACSLLQRAGFTKVTNISGGFDAWLAASLPVCAGEEHLAHASSRA